MCNHWITAGNKTPQPPDPLHTSRQFPPAWNCESPSTSLDVTASKGMSHLGLPEREHFRAFPNRELMCFISFRECSFNQTMGTLPPRPEGSGVEFLPVLGYPIHGWLRELRAPLPALGPQRKKKSWFVKMTSWREIIPMGQGKDRSKMAPSISYFFFSCPKIFKLFFCPFHVSLLVSLFSPDLEFISFFSLINCFPLDSLPSTNFFFCVTSKTFSASGSVHLPQFSWPLCLSMDLKPFFPPFRSNTFIFRLPPPF